MSAEGGEEVGEEGAVCWGGHYLGVLEVCGGGLLLRVGDCVVGAEVVEEGRIVRWEGWRWNFDLRHDTGRPAFSYFNRGGFEALTKSDVDFL